MCKTYNISFLFVSKCVRVYSFHSVESVMSEHVMSVVATLQISTKHKLLSVQENLHIISKAELLKIFLQKN